MGIASAIAGVVQGVAQAGYGIYQDQRNYRENKRQFDEQMAWNKHVQNVSWQREDTQFQRAKADAEAAGYSPLAAVGQGVSGTTVAAPGGTGAGGQQVDFSGITQGIMLDAQHEHENDMQEKQIENEQQMQADKIDAENQNNEANRKLQEEMQSKNLASVKQIAMASNQKDLTIAANMLQETSRHNTEQETIENSRLYLEWYKEHHIQGTGEPQVCKTREEYENKLADWWRNFDFYIEQSIGSDENIEVGNNAESGYGGSLSAGAGKSKAGINANTSSSEHGRKTTNSASRNARQIDAYLRSNPMPIYLGDRK